MRNSTCSAVSLQSTRFPGWAECAQHHPSHGHTRCRVRSRMELEIGPDTLRKFVGNPHFMTFQCHSTVFILGRQMKSQPQKEFMMVHFWHSLGASFFQQIHLLQIGLLFQKWKVLFSMLCNGFLQLRQAAVLEKKALDWWPTALSPDLQKAVFVLPISSNSVQIRDWYVW